MKLFEDNTHDGPFQQAEHQQASKVYFNIH